MIVGTAGHVDHGKTSLVRALTGVDTDRLPEEKARGISIELGFAYASLGGRNAEPIGFVDVPGHRRFVQTMIAGAAGIDVGLLVVAADDGPMPQTREHVAILQWLGVRDVVVALTKVDAVDAAQVEAAAAALDALLEPTAYRGAEVLRVSSVSGAGLDALRATLVARSDRLLRDDRPDATAPSHRRFRLAIDRVFVLQGIGLVVTGTCFSGRIAIDDPLTSLPGGLDARVRGIHAQNRPVREAHAGQRIALNLAGRGIEKDSVRRGGWVVEPSIAIETDRIDAQLSPRADASGHEATSGSFDTRTWRSVRFHAGASSCNARVVLLAPGSERQSALAQLVFERPLHLVAGDRFVLRDASGLDGSSGSLAGGTVLDVDVPVRGRRSESRLRFLKRAATDDATTLLADAVEGSAKGVDLARWNVTRNVRLEPGAVDARAVGGKAADGSVDHWTLFSRDRWDGLRGRLLDALAAEHARTPEAVGPGRDRLRRITAPSLDPIVFAALVDELREQGRLVQAGAWLHLPGHRVELSPEDTRRFVRIRAQLADAAEANNPPRVRDIARSLPDDEEAVRGLCVRLAARGELYRVAHDHYFLPATMRALAAAAVDVAASDGVAKAAPFRDRIGVGRKVAIQVLEFFDRVGFTRRIGDDHRIIQPTLFDA